MTAITASPVSVDFHGTAIPTFSVEGIVRVAMKPICEGIGLQWHAQRKRIQRHPVLSQGACMIKAPSQGESMMDSPLKGGIQKVLTLPLNKLNGWLFGVDTNRVKPEVRERLVEYQAECFDVLSDYWQKGEAINPRASTVGERRPLNRAVRTLANLRSARGEAADYGGMWKLVNGYLGVAHIEDASPAQLDQAMGFVQDAIEAESSRIIEGDWLAKESPARKAEFVLTQDQARDLYLLLHAVDWVNFRWHQGIGQGVSAINRRLYAGTFEHVDSMARASRSLDKQLTDIRQHFSYLGGQRPTACALNGAI